MAKRLKLRLSRILSNCRSKDVLPSDPLPPVPNPAPLPSSLPPNPASVSPTPSSRRKQTFRWKQEKDFHVISISTLRENPPRDASRVFPRPSASRRPRRRRAMVHWGRKHGRVCLSPLPIFRGDDAAAWDDKGLEADDREETEYLISSTPSAGEEGFCDEACEVEKAEEGGLLLTKRRVSEVEFEARLSSVGRRWCLGDDTTTKVRESYAVVKRTEDPYGEFRRSMMEMVTEKEIYEEEGLQELVRCLLMLNGREHHGIILQAFAEVCDALFRKQNLFDYKEDLN
ncbi:hypothetical protein MLD38_004655 [Melastoma candidum]|uniref:Uncharacterized protein n=1 Tax=Melastoma candidum TaxID=119954 RepID=A0ACB9SBC6_9MYRT|nr:hypothetical protein MLD38_004655 [Melastoma candidum]